MTIAESQMAPQAVPGTTPYPVNIRITIPFLPRSFFITLIVGPEKRGRTRLHEERQRHPLNMWGNLATFVATWSMITISGLFALMVLSAL